MKRVLIVTYYFPPSGGPGVQRVLKLVKYLPQFGWHPVVLTVANGDFPARDESLLKEISPGVPVYRTNIIEPYGLYRALTGKKKGEPVDVNVIPEKGARRPMSERLASWIRGTLFIPDARMGWRLTAVSEGMRVIHKEKISAIYSSSPPHTCGVIARSLKRRSGLPWIAGFRDPWTGFENTPSRWALPRAIDHRMEKGVCHDADAIDVAWLGIRDGLLHAHPELAAKSIVHLPNGFDGEDYPAVERSRNERFTMTYTGSMYGTRNPRDILRAVGSLAASKLIDLKKIVLKFVGRFGDDVARIIAESPVRDCVETVPYLPHRESIKALLQSDALLLIVDEISGSGGVVPGKVYEYLGAGKPVLAIAEPDGVIANLLRETDAGAAYAHSDADGIAAAFLDLFRRFHGGEPMPAARPEVVKKFERKECARGLAEMFDALTCPPTCRQ
jgi:glycosyltransferase involved in cell wall biosynthesis